MTDSTVALTVVFPGQGSQYVGMGKGLPPQSQRYFQRASDVIGLDLQSLCLSGPAEKLNLTENTQPALVATSIALWETVRPFLVEKKISLARTLGHSAGEYAALVCSGALSFEDAIACTRLRGKFMQQAVPPGEGAMTALIRVKEEVVKETCQTVSRGRTDRVWVANLNSDDQVVISGHHQAVKRALEELEKKKLTRYRAVALPVSAPFHCPLMKPATEKLQKALEDIAFHPLKIPYVANVDGREYPQGTPGETVRKNLVEQVESSVQWNLSTQVFEKNPVVLEVGPGRVLKGLVKKCRPDAFCHSLEDENALDELVHSLKERSKR